MVRSGPSSSIIRAGSRILTIPRGLAQTSAPLHPEERVALGQDEEGGRPRLRQSKQRQRTCPLAPSVSIEHTLLLAPGMDVAEQLELSTNQRMDG